MKKIKSILPLLGLLLLSFLVGRFLLRPGFFITDDGGWAIVRLASMKRILRAGQFPARWSAYLNHGYGYPLFNFTYPLPYYLGAGLSFFGWGLINTIKLEFLLTIFLSALGMYLLVKNCWGKWAGFLAAFFYLMAPFRLVNLYVRGSLGELWAMAFYPWIFWAIRKLWKKRSRAYFILSAVLMAGLFLAHNISSLFFIPMSIMFAWYQGSRKTGQISRLKIMGLIGLSLGLSAFFTLPALWEKKYTVLSQIPLANIEEHFLNLNQLLFSPWGYGSPLAADSFSFQLGWPLLALTLISLITWLKTDHKSRLFSFSFLALLVLIFLMLPISGLFWQLPLINSVDFPWRLLGSASFFLSITAVWSIRKKFRWLGVLVLVLMLIFYLPQARPAEFISQSDAFYQTNDATTTSNDELLPVWVEEKPRARPDSWVLTQGQVADLVQKSGRFEFKLKLDQPDEVQINHHFFPGWQAKVDGQEVRVTPEGKQGLITFGISAGNHQVKVEFKNTWIRGLANWLSVLSLGLSFLLLTAKKLFKNP